MTIKEIRTLSGLTQAAFADKYQIPKRTIEDWEAGRRSCPIYTQNLLQEAVKRELLRSRTMQKKTIAEIEELSGEPFAEGITEYVDSCIRQGYTDVKECADYLMRECNLASSEYDEVLYVIEQEFRTYE